MMSEQARDMVNTIIEVYIPEFQKIEKHLLQRYQEELNNFLEEKRDSYVKMFMYYGRLYRDIIEQWF